MTAIHAAGVPSGISARIAANIAAVRAEIAQACARVGRDPGQVRLIAVTKTQGPEVLPVLAANGITDVGENRLEHQALMRASAPAGLAFHAIGRVQGRQFPQLVPITDVLHSLASPDHVDRLAGSVRGAPLPVFLQINTSGEAAKAGIPPATLPDLLAAVRAKSALQAVGLMTMAPEGAAEADLRACFAALRRLAGQHGLPRLSMGMSQDFPIAIEEGATDIRVGTRLFH